MTDKKEKKPLFSRGRESESTVQPEEPQVAGVACEHIDRPYKDQWELMADQFALIDYRLYLYYKNHRWLGPQSDMRNMLGLVVSREEFEHNLIKSAQTGLCEKLSIDEKCQITIGEAMVSRRLAKSGSEFPLMHLFERFALDQFEKSVLVLAYAALLDSKYERLFAYLQDDITKKLPGIDLAAQLYLPEGKTVEEYRARMVQPGLFQTLFDPAALASGELRLQPCVEEYLSTGTISPGAGMSMYDGSVTPPDDPLVVGDTLAETLDAVVNGGAQAVTVTGEPGSGRRFQITHLMSRKKGRCLFVDMEALEYKPEYVYLSCLIARLLDAYVCLHGLDVKNAEGDLNPPPTTLLDAISHAEWYKEPLFLVSQKRISRQVRRVTIELETAQLQSQERLDLFRHYFANIPVTDEVSLQELASKFRFVPRQIKGAAVQAAGLCKLQAGGSIDNVTIHKCCYRQVVHKLDNLAKRVEPCFTWEDVVLPEDQKQLMQQACSHIRFQHRVYQEWGFNQKIGYGRGLSILFAGVPGTGKTMCAQVIANQLNMQMYKINISQIVSKYIGETEKNLQAVFNEARRSNCILFFDECDAIFGKRSDVKDAHDRNANVEVAYLLQQIEDHDGVSVLATNLVQNIDAAFMRRITYVVHFPFPDAAQRKEIYLRTLPPQAPVDPDVDWNFIAEKFELSGGHIKNIVLGAAFMAASEGRSIGMRHVLTAAVNELRKNEIVVVKEELREYADLIFS